MHGPFLKRTYWLCLWLAGAVLFAACRPSPDKRPANLIPPERMASILTDVHLAEARISRMGIGSIDSANIVYKRLESQIFRKFQVDTSAYTKSYIYYSSHPQEMEAVYKQVVEQLKKKAVVQKPTRS